MRRGGPIKLEAASTAFELYVPLAYWALRTVLAFGSAREAKQLQSKFGAATKAAPNIKEVQAITDARNACQTGRHDVVKAMWAAVRALGL
jgi:hypothetical protein